ncbi:MAG TPA: ABC transporter permease subunit [Acidimicrobiales bacterium]|nr:ABC transporter permease subunit [Acidimicrobiales bacterium]
MPAATRGLTDLTAAEVGHQPGLPGRRRSSGRRTWLVVALAAVGWSLWSAGVGREELVNPGGWTLLARFWAAAVDPELSAGFLAVTWRASLTTVAFAVLGTALSVAIGVVGGVLTSETWWRRPRSGRLRPGWYAGRGLAGLPRGAHEAVWGLFLVNVLGRDPMVGILAIAIPFGAITAKVYAELIDESAAGPYEALRAAGVGRVAALAYAVFPRTLPDLVSYAFYRLECSIRSAVILGMIGAGGLGLELNLAFQSLRYREMWTLIYALVAISALADLWGASLRRRGTATGVRYSLATGAALVVAAFVHLRPDLGRLFAARTRDLLADIAGSAWPPAPPADGWGGLLRRAAETVEMSVLAIAIGGSLAVVAAFVAARGGETLGRRAVAAGARMLLLVTRAIPPPVWALLVLFVMFPGPLPGAVALGIYNFGILGRLMAEVVENLDPRPGAALQALGARPASRFAYATLPLSVARFAAYSLYRWEVAVRETVVVGVVGAGGLGRLLEQQRAAFNYQGMLATVIALVALSIVVDLVSAAARRSLR